MAAVFERRVRLRSAVSGRLPVWLAVLALCPMLASCDDDKPARRTGVQRAPISSPPEAGCSMQTYGEHEYWFCSGTHTGDDARARCDAQPWMHLVRIDDAAERDFLEQHFSATAWIGGSDALQEGNFRWLDNGDSFWSGGAAVAGRFNDWRSGEPDDASAVSAPPAVSTQLWNPAQLTNPNGTCTAQANGDSAYWTCTQSLAWDTARSRCTAVSADLVSITTAAESTFVNLIATGSSDWLIGVQKRGLNGTTSGQWRWLDGGNPSTGYSNWGLFEPGSSDCGAMASDQWKDIACSSARAFICEDTTTLPIPDAAGPQVIDLSSAQRRFTGSTLGLSNGVAVSGLGCGITAASTDAVFWFNLTGGTVVSIDLAGSTFGNARVALFRSTLDSQGYAGAGSRCAMVAAGSAVELSAELASGSYYAVVTSTSGTGAYDITFDSEPVGDCVLAHDGPGWSDDACNRPDVQHGYICESDVSDCTIGVDADGDGAPDCFDECPADASHQLEGDCGCPSAAVEEGALCTDGICSANRICDGEGNCGAPSECAPDTDCSYETRGTTGYFFCDNLRTAEEARALCAVVPGMHLVHVHSEEQEAFLRDHIAEGSWLGATDGNAEGYWLWPDDATQFWQGAVNGNAVANRYANWLLSDAPDNVDGLGWPVANCAALQTDLTGPVQSAAWSDFACHDQRQRFGYVCEIALRTECLLPTDLDQDGTLDCRDTCPLDAAKIVPGDCGCADAPLPSGTSCDDGWCAANNQCDGDGNCGEPLDCAPAASCVPARYEGKVYWSCAGSFTWTAARDACRTRTGLDLVRIDDAAENAFVRSVVSGNTWIGANDRSSETEWRWAQRPSDNGPQFWNSLTAAPVNGLFRAWGSGEPDLFDCGQIGSDGTWRDADCSQNGFGFVCESVIDKCALDANKHEPGQCGCGVADTDSDADQTANCNDQCPNDSNKVAPGRCGCGNAETDSDGDGTANCVDACPNDNGKVSAGICGCGVPDVDGDGDGILNCQDLCPADPLKSAPGFCGCGERDIDSDDDGTPDCSELCPNDPDKLQPGVCGCGVSDDDGDGDTTFDCLDECPSDSTKVVRGTCGCADDPEPQGTACNDGLCSANVACDGEGQCGSFAQCAPEPGCVHERVSGRLYYFCPSALSWSAAEAACGGPGFRQARIESAAENAYVAMRAANTWLGARDPSEGLWQWQDSSLDAFWSGGPEGGPIGGRYSSWALEQPDDLYGTIVYPAAAVMTQLWDPTLALAAPPTGSCTGYTWGSRAYWTCTSSTSWDTARSRCQTAGADLISAATAPEDTFLASIAQGLLTDWHVGLQKRGLGGAASGTWQWLDGTTLGSYAHWGLFEPGASTCGSLRDGAWRAISCTSSQRYVCEDSTPALKVADLASPQVVDVYGAARLFSGNTLRMQSVVDGTLMGCGAGFQAPDAVFRFTLTERTHVTIDLSGSDNNTKVGLFAGAINASGYADAGSECASTGTLLTETLDAGTYYAVVTGDSSNARKYQVLFSGVRQGSPGADCAALMAGTWIDTSCAESRPYVCEVPVDECPADGSKLVPGVCGCGSPDSDGDGDGTPNCVDRCPLDAHQVEPGDCGCASAPKRSGTPCGTGLCAANDTCDGAGRCGEPMDCAPADGCGFVEYAGMASRGYFVCTDALSWSASRTQCQSQPRMELARIDGAAENAFVAGELANTSWLAANDRTVEQQWYWQEDGVDQSTQFWSGDENGHGVGGLYSNWQSSEPNDLLGEDCGGMLESGFWNDLPCGLSYDYVCEIGQDLCPHDWKKWEPGECGCGVPEDDSDGDGRKDCFDACPFDPARTMASQGHCAFTYVGDGVLRTDALEGPLAGAADGDGNVLFVWQAQQRDHAELHARRFNASGLVLDWAPIVLDANVSIGWAAEPRVAGFEAGGWAVVWTDEDGDEDLSGIALRTVSSAGQLGATGIANRSSANRPDDELLMQWGGRIAPVDDGFVVVWISQGDALESGTALRARLYSAAAQPLGPSFAVASARGGDQLGAEVTGRGQDWLVAWEDFDADELRARRFVGEQAEVEITVAAAAHSPSVAPLASGGDFAIAWVNASFDVMAAELRAGMPLGTAITVSPGTASRPQERPSAAHFASAAFAVAFQYADGYHDGDFGMVDPLDTVPTQPGEALLRARLTAASNQSQVILINAPGGLWAAFVDDGTRYYGGSSQLVAFFLQAP
jgi:hypothetical protein